MSGMLHRLLLLAVVLMLLLQSRHVLAQEEEEEQEEAEEGYGEQELCREGDEVCFSEAALPKGANAEGAPRKAEMECKDRHKQCVTYAEQGECEKNPGWMIINCPLSCDACHLRDPKLRCDRRALNMTLEPAYAPGDMNAMFESIVTRFGDVYEIEVLSMDPWIVTFDNFLTADEAKALISTVKSWERSTDTGSTNEFGETGRILSTGRTSSNAWCTHECESHPDVQNIMTKIEQVTNVPRGNYESFQVLRYEIGQKYVTHHDYGSEEVALACGPRILTFFLYLSDVEEGGETNFPALGISVKPKRGRALLWPSTLSDSPEVCVCVFFSVCVYVLRAPNQMDIIVNQLTLTHTHTHTQFAQLQEREGKTMHEAKVRVYVCMCVCSSACVIEKRRTNKRNER